MNIQKVQHYGTPMVINHLLSGMILQVPVISWTYGAPGLNGLFVVGNWGYSTTLLKEVTRWTPTIVISRVINPKSRIITPVTYI